MAHVVDHDGPTLFALLQGSEPILLIDVREREAFRRGHLPQAINIPKRELVRRLSELRSSKALIGLYCEAGPGSRSAANELLTLGYRSIISLSGGYRAWVACGLPVVSEMALTETQIDRYSRHLSLTQVGENGQHRLLRSKVLLIGAGGLGCPAALYLAAAGIGTLGVVDADVVDLSNLQRQVLHRTSDVGRAKVDSAARSVRDLNPDTVVEALPVRLGPENAIDIIKRYDVVIDGTDNFDTKYQVNDAAYFAGKPVVQGSIFQFMGMVTVFASSLGGPCYRCVHPVPPDPALVPT